MKKKIKRVMTCSCHYCDFTVESTSRTLQEFEAYLKSFGWGMVLDENACPVCYNYRKKYGLAKFCNRVEGSRKVGAE